MIARLHLAVALTATMAGCGGPSVREVCDNLDQQASCFDEWSYDDCIDDGSYLEDDARLHGCDAEFDDYLACVNVTICTADKECAVERETVDACVGGFP